MDETDTVAALGVKMNDPLVASFAIPALVKVL